MTIHQTLLNKLVVPLLTAALLSVTPVIADELKDISTLAEQGQQDAALERVNAYLEANPKDAQGMFMKGIILAEAGKRNEAIKTFNALTKTYPNLPEPYNNLAVLHAEAGEYELAKKALETAIKTHPSYATAHENLGDIYARMASEAYDKALQLDNGNARASNKLALIKDLFSTGAKNVAANTETPTRPIRPADTVEPTPTVAPTPTPAPTPTTVDVAQNQEAAISAAVESWRNAWASQDIEQYFASYADSFIPAKGRSRQSWESFRRGRVSAPAGITLKVNNPSVEMVDDDNAKVSFKQFYQAKGRRAIHTNKTLVMKKVGDAWLIDKEIASN